MTAAAIIDYLISLEMNWLAVLAYGVGYLAYDLSGLCTHDPPAIPDFTAARVFGYTNPLNPQGAQQLREDVTALIGHYLWFTYCECVSGAQPTPGPVPQPPPGQQTDNPQINSKPAGPCANGPGSFTSIGFDANGNATPAITAGSPFTTQHQWISIGVSMTPTGQPTIPWPHAVDITVQQLQSTTVLQSDVIHLESEETAQESFHNFTLVPGITNLRLLLHSDGAAGTTGDFAMQSSMYCTAPPTGVAQPCCPPDPVLIQLLTTVLSLEQTILSELGGTTAYIRGTAHSGAQGTGSIGLSRARGMAADVVVGTPTAPILPGNPPYQWDLGWMSISDGGGMIQEMRLTRQHQVWLPAECENAVVFGYFLNPGVVVTFTELIPAPTQVTTP
jgi:hypothetical protein